MKKILGGCLIVLVIAAVGLGVAGFYAYRAARPMFDNAADYVARARELSSLSDQVRNQSPYTPPPAGELTVSQVERFIAVQGRVRSELGGRWTEFEKTAESFKQRAGQQSEWSFSEISAMASNFMAIYTEARKAHVTALNVHKFSDEEFSWVRLRIYEAAGMELAGSFDTSVIEALVRDGAEKNGVAVPDLPKLDVPPANIALVKPHAGKLKEWLPMAMLGL